MPTRYMRNSAILAKIEVTPGTDSVPIGGSNAVLVSNVTVNQFNAQNVDRDVIRAYMGASEQLVGVGFVELAFDVELQSSGGTFTTAATVPAWGPLLRSCGFAETATNGASQSRVEYLPISASFESCSIYYHMDGVRHIATMCRGNVEFMLNIGGIPKMRFSFKGVDGGVSAQSNPALTLTGWITPTVVTDPNTADLLLGATYVNGSGTAAPSLSGGTSYPSRGLEASANNTVEFMPLLGQTSVEITNRGFTGKITMDLTAAQQVTFDAAVKANTTTSLGLQHGSTNGRRVIVHAPAAQMLNQAYEDFNGKTLVSYDLRFVPSSGNDEFRLVVA